MTMLPDGSAEAIREAHDGFERARKRAWLERIRVGLEYRRSLRAVEDGVAAARRERDELVRNAVADGASYREMGRALGLSHSRIQQIVNEGKPASAGGRKG
jgi:hypothetical protein